MKIFPIFFTAVAILVANPAFSDGPVDAGPALVDDTKYIEWVQVEEVLENVDIEGNDLAQVAELITYRTLQEGFYCGINIDCGDNRDITPEVVPSETPEIAPVPTPLPFILLGSAIGALAFFRRKKK